MGRTRSPEIQKRNDIMYADWQRGESITSVAARNGIARQVAARIIASYHPEEDEDTDRSVYRGELWRLYDEVGELYKQPGHKMAPTGGPARGPDGEPAEDTNVKVQAGELRLKVLRELRLLDARDRPAQQHVRHSHEFYAQQASESMAELRAKVEAERRELEELRRAAAAAPPVVAGEVVGRELPPAS